MVEQASGMHVESQNFLEDRFGAAVHCQRVETLLLSARRSLVEVFNLTNRVNTVTMNASFGAGAYPTNPSATFGQVTAVGDPRSVQFGLRFRF